MNQALPLFEDLQTLPGMDFGLRPALWLVPAPVDAEVPPTCPGQLRFGWEQLEVWDVEPEPRQPSLLPPPTLFEELWEAPVPPAEEAVRPRRREPQARPPRRVRRPAAGQLALFG